MPTKPKTDGNQSEAAPEDDESPQASTTADAPDGPRPWRVEPFSDGAAWGWRLCAADGTVVHESGLDYDSSGAAVTDARDDDRTEGSTFPAQR